MAWLDVREQNKNKEIPSFLFPETMRSFSPLLSKPWQWRQ
jgi:hypothetical protein